MILELFCNDSFIIIIILPNLFEASFSEETILPEKSHQEEPQGRSISDSKPTLNYFPNLDLWQAPGPVISHHKTFSWSVRSSTAEKLPNFATVEATGGRQGVKIHRFNVKLGKAPTIHNTVARA